MAQQTINVGTAPNDGTGTPLRTAFQYTNSNFSELYTAVGPSGNNIVVPGSATITGDLTVDTSTLKVDSANNRVGINTATPVAGSTLHIVDSDPTILLQGNQLSGTRYNRIKFANQPGSINYEIYGGYYGTGGLYVADYTNNGILFGVSNTPGTFTERYKIDSAGVATWSNVGGVAGTAMTLNATGLGVGVSPAAKLHVLNTSLSGTTAGSNVIATLRSNGSGYDSFLQFSDNVAYNAGLGMLAGNLYFYTNGAERARIDTSGNVGIGVTPSAWTLKSLQIVAGGIYGSGNETGYYANAFYGSSGWRYINAAGASGYLQNGGSHQWYRSTSANVAGTDPVFDQAMTLDASGNLLVGKTAIGTTVGVEVRPDGYIIATRSASTDAAAFTNAVYSTGASAYRFYVGLGGTVYATNTTISAISDARLKENVQDIDVGLGAILALKPRKFDWKAGKGKDIKGDRGFIAQEFEQVFPQLVDEWADPAPEGETPYKSVRQDLIPVLVKAIQELAAEVNALKNA